MGSFAGTCEIVEEKDEWHSVKHSGRHHQINSESTVAEKSLEPPVPKVGYKGAIEDDIDKLFQSISMKTSPKVMGSSHQAGTSTSTSAGTSRSTSPSRRNALKKPITACMPRSPRVSPSEPVSLKQALRDLCISKASEMAAIRRLSKSTASPRISEAERIKSLYNTVLVESSSRSGLPGEEGRGEMAKALLTLEQNRQSSSQNAPQQLQALEIKPPSESARTSSQIVIPSRQDCIRIKPLQDGIDSAFGKVGNQISETEISSKSTSTPSITGPNGEDKGSEQDKNDSSSSKPADEQAAPEFEGKERLIHVASSGAVRAKRLGKPARNVTRISRPVLRHKVLLKKRIKPVSIPSRSPAKKPNGVDGLANPAKNEMFCQRCHCALKNASIGVDQESERSSDVNHDAAFSSGELNSVVKNAYNEANKDSLASPKDSVSAEVGLGYVTPLTKKQNIPANNCNGASLENEKEKENPTSSEKAEFSLSSKDSLGDHSSTTSMSEESNLSRLSFCNKPHMSKDVRWEAIRHVRMQHGAFGLRHFNLLKKLGCGDIGTVYLAELIGTNCLFAIKVMDNEFLARRKKMPRAQTERDILRMLDHPFLPTLYSQFTSDNLSCLVMEYCPGGDLHVLRQRQPCRCFPEPAARFYVAEVLLALEYLHMLGVIYRDLKPENILVRDDGHIMLTDFDLSLRCSVNPTLLQSSSPPQLDPARFSGPQSASSCIDPLCIEPSCRVPCFSPKLLPNTAKSKSRKLKKAELVARLRSLPQLVAEPTDARSNSFVGTHEYLAPEIIKGEGHGAAVDWWTFGILLYELLYSKTPFKGCHNEETVANVVLQSLKFPDSPLVSFQARDLIRHLLVKEPENRLGSVKGAAEIKQHPFFEGLNWALIRCAIPPELPDFYDFGVSNVASPENKSKFLECKAIGDHLEFELF